MYIIRICIDSFIQRTGGISSPSKKTFNKPSLRLVKSWKFIVIARSHSIPVWDILQYNMFPLLLVLLKRNWTVRKEIYWIFWAENRSSCWEQLQKDSVKKGERGETLLMKATIQIPKHVAEHPVDADFRPVLQIKNCFKLYVEIFW